MGRLFCWKRLLLFLILNFVTAERIKDMIYMSFDGAAACFRRHNGTHQFGCSSSRSGSVGVVHLVETESDLMWLEKNATAGPYTIVLPFSMFTGDILSRLRGTDNISGVLLINNLTESRPPLYSPEDTCPNRYSGYKTCEKPWNPYGYALLMENWPFPMFYMENQTHIEAIKACFWKHNAHNRESQAQRSLCALEMRSFMFAAVNSESCIRRSGSKLDLHPTQFCDPLGDRNVHWPLFRLNKDGNSVILVTARLDASSLFDGLAPGAGSTVTGIVTLLATAHYLNSLNATTGKTNVVFSLLNGEAFDYIGSSRMVYDLKQGNFNVLGGVNLKLNEVHSVIELDQLGDQRVYIHAKNENSEFVKILQQRLSADILENSVPPTSAQTFLKERSNITTVVISSYKGEFTNPYYNGILDDAQSLKFESKGKDLASNLAKVAINLGKTLYQQVTNSSSAPVMDETATEKLILDMLHCYLESAKCDLFRAASAPGAKLTKHTLPLYVSVHRVPNPATSLTAQLLALLTGEQLPEMNEATCHEERLAWMGGFNFTGVCIKSSVNFSVAVSPAFIIDGYDMKSGVFSTWTESIWQMLGVRMFLKPSAGTERLSMILGSVVAGLSFIFVWFVNSRADILFNSSNTVDC
ncbi:nicastrin [Prorops nasuta]|uniref:nicastrin n=1 Tax=Prorops nasuta TaxID=863751 RepID=UPI0034D0084C